jgi:exopolysaccharide biosynthesis protein
MNQDTKQSIIYIFILIIFAIIIGSITMLYINKDVSTSYESNNIEYKAKYNLDDDPIVESMKIKDLSDELDAIEKDILETDIDNIDTQ